MLASSAVLFFQKTVKDFDLFVGLPPRLTFK